MTERSRPAEGHPSAGKVSVILLRAIGSAAALVLLYYVVPLQGRFSATDVALLPVGLAAFGGLTWYGIRRIINSTTPRAVMVQVLAVVFPLFIVVFAASYFLMSREHPGSFSARLTRTDALYFTVTVFSTVGFGDLVAVSETARLMVTGQMVGDLIVIGAGVHLLAGAIRIGDERRQTDSGFHGGTDRRTGTGRPTPSPEQTAWTERAAHSQRSTPS